MRKVPICPIIARALIFAKAKIFIKIIPPVIGAKKALNYLTLHINTNSIGVNFLIISFIDVKKMLS